MAGHFPQRQHLPAAAVRLQSTNNGLCSRALTAAGVRGWALCWGFYNGGGGGGDERAAWREQIHFHWFVQIALNGPGNNCWQSKEVVPFATFFVLIVTAGQSFQCWWGTKNQQQKNNVSWRIKVSMWTHLKVHKNNFMYTPLILFKVFLQHIKTGQNYGKGGWTWNFRISVVTHYRRLLVLGWVSKHRLTPKWLLIGSD